MAENEIRRKLENYTSKQRGNVRANAERRLQKNTSDLEAQEILRAIKSLETTRRKSSVISTGFINWESHGHSSASHGFVDGKAVATIRKKQNHTYTNQEIYSVEFMGEELARDIRYIADARNLAEEKYRERATRT